MPSLDSQIAANLDRVQQGISAAAAGRSIRLVCVTKYASVEQALALLRAGAAELGENYLPGAAARFEQFRQAGRPFKRHLLGPQQSRKLRLIPDACDLYQALTSLNAAQQLHNELTRRERSLDVLLQINLDSEPQKPGWELEAVFDDLSILIAACPSLVTYGLMAIPMQRRPAESHTQYEDRTRGSFRRLRAMFDRIAAELPVGRSWSTLSMGMSQDYTWAIEEGATMVRVGSALFAGLEG